MDRYNREKIFREVLSAIIGSRLKSSELKMLADLLNSDGSFSYELGRMLYDVSKSMDPQLDMPWSQEPDSTNKSANSGLVDLAYNVVQRRRLPKSKLISLFHLAAPRSGSYSQNEDLPARELIRIFLERATTAQAQRFLQSLGMDVAQDPYLGGISKRSGK